MLDKYKLLLNFASLEICSSENKTETESVYMRMKETSK